MAVWLSAPEVPVNTTFAVPAAALLPAVSVTLCGVPGVNVKIDDPKSPLTAMFHGQEFDISDETYTFAQDSFSRANVHVLTSIDYDKMSPADKAKERNPRTDSDYAQRLQGSHAGQPESSCGRS